MLGVNEKLVWVREGSQYLLCSMLLPPTLPAISNDGLRLRSGYANTTGSYINFSGSSAGRLQQ